jgi:hypothetical protein
MATLTADRAAATFPVTQGNGPANVCVAWGKYTLTANPTAADILKACKVPAGAVVFAGWVRGEDLDTGTEALDLDVGWAANGSDDADPDGFGNLGVITGDVTTDVKPEVSILYQLNGTLKSGPVVFARETTLQIVFNVAANAGGTGVIWLCVLYYVP